MQNPEKVKKIGTKIQTKEGKHTEKQLSMKKSLGLGVGLHWVKLPLGKPASIPECPGLDPISDPHPTSC